MKFNLAIRVRRPGSKRPAPPERHPMPAPPPERYPALAPPSDIIVRISLPPAETASVPEWFELSSPGGTSLLLRLPGTGGLSFARLYKAVKEAGGTITVTET